MELDLLVAGFKTLPWRTAVWINFQNEYMPDIDLNHSEIHLFRKMWLSSKKDGKQSAYKKVSSLNWSVWNENEIQLQRFLFSTI